MLVSRLSPISCQVNTMELNVTQEQLDQVGSRLIQHIFPNLSPCEREFIKTGITEDEWDNLFKSVNM
jgi:hypothetical protein